ncbi:MAG: hypothetical protein FDZ69_03330 [Deltaproteobacteria bacterium]|nr:MAG: hypothetical protein FDZ69_03330 [Deltaproteobacteria bacterium]
MPKREPVRVAVIFEPGKRLRPVWFDRHRCRHMVRETTYSWQGRAGDKPLLHFTVTDGEALFELVYNPLDGTWLLSDQQALS